jgi:hypothetical protein
MLRDEILLAIAAAPDGLSLRLLGVRFATFDPRQIRRACTTLRKKQRVVLMDGRYRIPQITAPQPKPTYVPSGFISTIPLPRLMARRCVATLSPNHAIGGSNAK